MVSLNTPCRNVTTLLVDTFQLQNGSFRMGLRSMMLVN